MTLFYSIVPAQNTDAAEIARLSIELGYPAIEDETRAALTKLLKSPRHFAVVAADRTGQLIGWAAAERRLTLESGEIMELTGLVVAVSARRLGVGKALVSAAERWALQEGFLSIRVRSNATREESHPFYTGIGFQRTKMQHVYKKSLPSAV
jgi:GNAT superfamily N-acetyltransferase